jgi:hypothetical protein
MIDGNNNVTGASGDSTSGDVWDSNWSSSVGASGSGMSTYIWNQYASDLSTPQYASSRMTDTISMRLTTTSPVGSCFYGYIEILPSVALEPTTPSFHTISVNDYSSLTFTNGGTTSCDAPVSSNTVGDVAVVYSVCSRSITSWNPPVGFATIYSRTTAPAIYIGWKVVGTSENYSMSVVGNSSGTGSITSYGTAIKNGQYDTVGAAVTNTSGGPVNMSVSISDNYSMAMAFVASSATGNWSNSNMSDNNGFNEFQTHAPGLDIFVTTTDLAAGTFNAGNFTAGTGGVGTTFGILASFKHK